MFWVEVLVHTAFFLFFLPIFYFEYVAPLQSYSVISDLFDIVQPELLDVALINSINSTRNITTAVNTAFDIIKSDDDVLLFFDNTLELNRQIKLNTYITCEFLGFFCLSIGIIITFYYGKSITDLLLTNLIVLIFIIISEFFIVGAFFKNFRELDADFMKAVIAKAWSNKGKIYPHGVSQCDYTDDFFIGMLPTWMSKLIYGYK
jgi:hypothetical protein